MTRWAIALFWDLWRERNNRVCRVVERDPSDILYRVRFHVSHELRFQRSFCNCTIDTIFCSWSSFPCILSFFWKKVVIRIKKKKKKKTNGMCNIYIITKYEALFSAQVVKVLLKFCFSLISDQIIFHHLSVSKHGSQVSQSHFWCQRTCDCAALIFQ